MSQPRELSREEIAKLEIGHTDVRVGTVRLLVLTFLISTVLVPFAQRIGEARTDDGTATAWSHLAYLHEVVQTTFARARAEGATRFGAVVAANRETLGVLDAFVDAVEDEALLGRSLRPAAQELLSGWLGAGNELAYVGRDGWLFFRPDVEYLTGPGFLAPARLAARGAGAPTWEAPPQPDPRPAIVRFKQDLEARGIALVVMPTPVKSMIHPEKLASGEAGMPVPLQNPSYTAFVRDLERAGVRVFDVAEMLGVAGRLERRPVYLESDTHWRPESVEAVAERLSAFLTDRIGLPPAPGARYVAQEAQVSNVGDIAVMLDLPPTQTLYAAETVRIRRILDGDGQPWRASRSADVLLLGDSFSNIYSLGSMGWGDGAGLAEQLSFALQRPVDRIVQNDDGASATRALLRRGIGSGQDRLLGKRVVVYQFAVRELTSGDWRLIDVPSSVP